MSKRVLTDTSYFKFYNANPKNHFGDDCVIRAIATALEQSWETTLRDLTEVGLKYGYVPSDKACYEKYLAKKGWVKRRQPRKYDNTKYTGREFCEQLAMKDVRYIAHLGGHHIVAIVNNQINDIWYSFNGCIGNYWVKSK